MRARIQHRSAEPKPYTPRTKPRVRTMGVVQPEDTVATLMEREGLSPDEAASMLMMRDKLMRASDTNKESPRGKRNGKSKDHVPATRDASQRVRPKSVPVSAWNAACEAYDGYIEHAKTTLGRRPRSSFRHDPNPIPIPSYYDR